MPKYYQMYKYYTSNSWILQANLSKFTIFVDYADFLCQRHYVNRSNLMEALIYQFR